MEAIIAAFEHGPVIGISATIVLLNVYLIILVIRGTRCFNKVLTRVIVVEDKMENIHDGCHIPREAMKEVQTDIKELQDKDNAMNIQLTGMNITLKNVDVKTTKIYNHFFEEGINK